MERIFRNINRLFLGLVIIGLGQLNAQNKPNSSTVGAKTPVTVPDGYTDQSKVSFVRSYVVFAPGVTEANIPTSTVTNVQMSTQYVDALGRPIQTVTKKGTPDQNDIVQIVHYDGFGRVTYQYMPYKAAANDGLIKVDPFDDQSSFLNSHFTGEDIFYGETEFENSPLNRATKSMAPGNSWAGSDKGVQSSWDHNTAAEGIRRWTVGATGDPSIPGTATYAAGELSVVITQDEEDNKVKQYTDKLGRVVLKQVQKGAGSTAGHDDWLNTYYLFDDFGNLRFVAPPRAVKLLSTNSWSWTTANIGELVFEYTYDSRNRMITKQVPGAEPVYMVYDKLDRLVLTQDGNQRAKSPDEWTFTKYDELNRPAMTGFLVTDDSRTTLQSEATGWNKDFGVKTVAPDATGVVEGATITVSNHISGTTKYHAETEVTILPGFETDEATESQLGGALTTDYTLVQGYYDATFPLMKNETMEVLTINYYDHYDFTSRTWSTDYTGLTGGTNAVTPAQFKYVTGMATGSKVKVLDTTDDWLTTVMFYDDRGRVVQTQADNHVGGQDITTSQYDFSGKVLKTYTKHTNPLASSNGTTTILKQFDYDHAGRLLSIEEKLNDTGSFKRLVTNVYNELGELESKKLGDATTPLETLDYKYNVRGWLKSINGDYVASGTGNHFFGMDLSYDFGFDTNQLNGNIAGVTWRSKSSAKKKAYGFDYDPVNRLTEADYTQYESSAWSQATADFSTAYSYDENGNILTLTREGLVAGSQKTIDDLEYNYGSGLKTAGNSNQLTAVYDIEGDLGQGDFKDGNPSGDDYTYDDNGNMTQDKNKGIDGTGDITYNHLNLPVTIEFDNNTSKTISYTYDAAGIKLQKKVNDGGTITTTDYIGGFIYQDNLLQQFAHEEGRVRLSGSSLVYDYMIKDHLGNTRMTLTEEVSVTEYRTTMETEFKTDEEKFFLNLDDSRVVYGAANTTSGGNEVSELNGYYSDQRVGPGKIISVSPGDQVDMDVDAFYTGSFGTANPLAEGDMATAVAAAFGGLLSAPAGSESRAIYDLFDDPNYAVLVGTGVTDSGEPRAYLNYMFFDQDFNFVSGKSGYKQISSLAGNDAVPEPLSASVSIDQGGFLYVYVSNETIVDFNVYFDELKITHTKGSILQEDHYYPFGMNISALSSTAPLSKPNQFKYNGFEFESSMDLNWYDYQARQYDPQLGRFTSVDPAADLMTRHSTYNYAFDNPIRFIDPDGMMPEDRVSLFDKQKVFGARFGADSDGESDEAENCPDGNCDTKNNNGQKNTDKDKTDTQEPLIKGKPKQPINQPGTVVRKQNDTEDATSYSNIALAGVGTSALIGEVRAGIILRSRSGYTTGKLTPNSARVFSKAKAQRALDVSKGIGLGLTAWGVFSTENQYREGDISLERRQLNHLNNGFGVVFPILALPVAFADEYGSNNSEAIIRDMTQPGGITYGITKFLLRITGTPASPEEAALQRTKR